MSCASGTLDSIGGVVQIAARTEADQYLTSDPQKLWYRQQHLRYVPHAILHSTATASNFNWEMPMCFGVAKTIDYLLDCWVKYTIPALTPASDATYAYYTNFIAARLTASAEIHLSNMSITGKVPHWLCDMADELMFSPAHKIGRMGGKRNTTSQLITDAQSSQTVWCKLLFANSLYANMALPVGAAPRATVNIIITSCAAKDVWVSDSSTAPTNATDNTKYTMEVYYKAVLLTRQERDAMSCRMLEMLFQQVTPHSLGGTPIAANQSSTSEVDIATQFRLPVKGLMFAFLESSKTTSGTNNWYAWSNEPVKLSIVVNNMPRTSSFPYSYYYDVMPQECATGNSNKYVGMYSYGMTMFSAQTYNTYNYSRQTDSYLRVLFDGSNPALIAYVVAFQVNVIRMENGVGFLVFGT